MANIADCIEGAVKAGQLDPARAKDARKNFEQLRDRYVTTMPLAQAEAAAAADLKEATEAAGRRRFHAVVNQLQTMRRIKHAIDTADDPAVAIRNLLEFSEGSGYRGESVRSLREAYEAQIHATIAEVLQETGLNVTGAGRNNARFNNLIRELHGEASGDPRAVELATAVRSAQDRMRRAFNAHGGAIGELDHYGVSHSHDVTQLRKAGFEQWRADIEGRLAWHQIEDVTTGRPFASSPGEIPARFRSDRFLRDVYEGVTTRGWDDKDPTMSVGGKALYNQRADHRVLHFKDGSSWLEYNKQYGASDPFSAMMNGLHGLARDVAMMRVLGPNPRMGLEYAIQVAQKRVETAASAAKPGDKLKAASRMAQRVQKAGERAKGMLAHVNGNANIPEDAAWASFFSGTRSVLTSIQLGSAVVSSVTDLGTIRQAAKFVGMKPANVLSRSVQLTASKTTRQTAARMGYVASALADAGGGSARYFGQLFGAGIPERLAGFTLRASGLSWVTDMRRIAFKMEFSGYLAENADRAFSDIDASLKQILEGRGVTASDWDALRDPAVRFVDPASGADFISPTYFLESQSAMSRAEAEGLSTRLEAIMQEQLEYAVPSASLEGRAWFQGTHGPGSIPGELSRSFMSYKSFALSLTLGQIRRWKALPGPMAKAQYAAEMSASLILLGALAIQLKELVKGNDPRPMDNAAFWGAALMQGGGLGIFGDFFAAEASRVGGGIGETIAGPVFGLAGDVIKPVASNVARVADGKSPLIGRDVANLVGRNTPVASSLWYIRKPYNALVGDTLQRWLDPDAEANWRRQNRRQERDYGNASWWAKGQPLPDRAPDLSSFAGGRK